MSALINPYILKINELNKEIDGLNLDKSVLNYELEMYKRNPVETVCIDSIYDEITHIEALINQSKISILQITKFLR